MLALIVERLVNNQLLFLYRDFKNNIIPRIRFSNIPAVMPLFIPGYFLFCIILFSGMIFGMGEMDIEYGMTAVDKNNKPLGTVEHIVMDSWSGEPRKFVIRPDGDARAWYFKPENVAEIAGEKVKLNVALEEMENT